MHSNKKLAYLYSYTHLIECIRLAVIGRSEHVPPAGEARQATVDEVHHFLRIAYKVHKTKGVRRGGRQA